MQLSDAFKGIIKALPQTCGKHLKTHHKKIHYFKDLKTGEVFCPACKMEELTHDQLKRMQKQVISKSRDNPRNYLKYNSLVDRQEMFSYSFDNFKFQKGSVEQAKLVQARKIAGFYYKNPDKTGNTLMFGNAGAGKTHLAMAILNAVNESSHNPMQKCVCLSMTALIKAMKDHFQDPTNNRWSSDYVEKIVKNADLVVIDDLGAESADSTASKFVQGTIQEIYEGNQRIITTTNLNMNQLKATYHERLVSRFLEGSLGKVIDFTQVKDKRPWR